MSSTTTIQILSDNAGADILNKYLPAGADANGRTQLANLITGAGGLAMSTRIVVTVDEIVGANQYVSQSATITIGANPVAAQTIILGNTTFTARASGAVVNEYNIGGTTAATATNLAVAISTSNSIGGLVVASAAGSVVTVASLVPSRWAALFTLVAGTFVPTFSSPVLTVTSQSRSTPLTTPRIYAAGL